MSKPERWNHWAVEHLPCKFDNDDGHDTYPTVSVPGGNWRPPASNAYVSSGEQEQDARLMAAAPDLLDALKEMATHFELTPEWDLCAYDRRLKARALAAIAKAGGAK